MKNPKTTDGTTRREFIQQLALCYAAAQMPLVFTGCKDDKPNFVGTGKAPYKVWEEMLMALETSPDHLEGRMKFLIASNDAKAMFDFVRDEIYLMPAAGMSVGYSGTQLKWGLKGTLRYGIATPREKAELLNYMYTQAKITSKVVFERTNIQPEEVPAFFLRPIKRNFGLDISKSQWKQWGKELQIKGNTTHEIPIYDEEHNESKALAEKLWQLLPNKEKLDNHQFDFRWDNYSTPTVEFILNGETKYAHLFDPTVAFGELKNDGINISEADPVKNNDEKISISISYRDSIDPRTEKEFVSGEWLSTLLVGNQINISFLNGLSLEQQAITPIGSLRTFTPALAFQSFDEEIKVMQENSFLGNPFTLDGKIIDVSGDEPKINGNTILKKPNTELQKKVSALKIKAFPANYPLVKLHVTPTDEDGAFVENLSTSDFSITDNSRQVQALMESNRPTPRVLILYDTSLSMPKEYYQEHMDAFIESLHQSILKEYPAAFITKWETPSEIFTWLLKASKSDYDLIIYATDGDNNDSYSETNAEIYKNGAPTIVLNVNDSESGHSVETFNKMAEITNGMVLKAKDQAKTLEAITDYISKMEIPPYVFTYYAVGTEEMHEAIVGVDNKRITVAEKFKFVTNATKEIGQSLIGLYCTVKTGNTTIKRVLAGWDPQTEGNIQPDYSDSLAVRNTILGGATLYFEGEGPTVSAALSDVLKYRLTTRSWGEALLDNDTSKAKEEFNEGGYLYHPEILPLMAPLGDAITTTSMTFSSGIRIAIIKHKIGVGEKASTKSFDYLPTSKYTTLTKDPDSAFKITLEKTTQLAIREGHFFTNSTVSELKNSLLLERQKAIDTQWFQEKKETFSQPYYWSERIHRGDGNFKIFDEAAESLAYWQINQKTGELFGMLADGTGGGSEETLQQLADIMAVLSVYIALLAEMKMLNPIGGTALSIVATYGVTLTKLYAIVCETIVIMDSSGMDDKIKAALVELAFNVYKTIAFGLSGSEGNIMSGLDALIGMMGLSTNPFGK
ncbi:hypothetical protein HPE56_15895 [Maribacter sp. ANRC-HE7]|uniref:VWFA domain-containing protein n=1 Tax=Maribacter aquimaris TaxID=2737171 RepID=A0ABR7V809_9FLAO|nr:hypothetical protein [Maribacter aquimaris]MBD0779283.1 hypothetical protein [Maribacter aquimaris]